MSVDLLQDDSMSLSEAMTLALALRERGAHVFPVGLAWDPTKYDGQGGIDKRPLNDHGHTDATSEPREVRRQFNKAPTRLQPGEVLGVGWWPGGSDRLVVDVDDKGDVRGSDALADLERQHGPLPDSLRLTTPSGGSHILLGACGKHIGNPPLAEGIDIRAHDGWVVAGGTRTPWGEWAWEGGIGLLEGGKIDDAPAWLLNRLTPASTNGTGPAGHWRSVDESKLHPADRAALAALRRLGGHSEYIPSDKASVAPFDKAYVAITRPGKRAGTSATIGFLGPGIVKVFSSGWPGLDADVVYDADELEAIADGRTPDDDVEDAASWEPIDLRPAWRGDKVRPPAEVFQRDDGTALLPPELNYLFGDSGDGKSFVALLAALEEIRAGRPPIWVSYEDANEDLIVDRLKLLGATEEEAAVLRFIVPQTTMSEGTPRIVELAENIGARLIVLDSVGEAMAVGGVNEDKDNEVGPWFRRTLRRMHDLNPALAILPIDHSTKSKDNPLFPSGSKRKRSAPTGRAYLLNVRSSFAVGAIGYVQLVVAKDRGGLFKRGDIAAEIMLDATDTPYRWTISGPREGDAYSPKLHRRTAAERVLEVLAESVVKMTAEQIARIANGSDRTQPGEARIAVSTVQNALTKLSQGAEATRSGGDRVDGRRTAVFWQSTSPDRDQGEAAQA